jgi:hypothetical protein
MSSSKQITYTAEQLSLVYPTTISYTTTIPLTALMTIMTGKILTTNDIFAIAASPVEGASVTTWLEGNGTNIPVDTAFDYKVGAYDQTNGVRNVIVMYYMGGKAYISYSQQTAV